MLTRIYLSCVGEQDPISPKNNQEGSLLTSFRYLCQEKKLQFTEAFLLPSSRETSPNRHTEDHAIRCAEKIENTFQLPMSILPLKVTNAADLKQVYFEMRRVLEQEVLPKAKACAGEVEFHINTSSATPQMKECWAFLASMGFFEPHSVQTWQVMDPSGGAQTLAERVRPGAELDLLIRESTLNRVQEFAKLHLYGTMAEELKRLFGNWERLFFKLCLALEAYDRGEYRAASNQFETLWLQLSDSGALQAALAELFQRQSILEQLPETLSNLLEAQKRHLSVLAEAKNPGFERYLVMAHYHHAYQRLKTGNYGDALVTAQTTCEIAVTYKLHQMSVPRNQTEGLTYMGKLNKLRDVDKGFAEFEQQQLPQGRVRNQIAWLNNMRNEKVHQGRPVDLGIARNALIIAKTVVNYCLNCKDLLIDEFPFNPDKVEGLLDFLLLESRKQLGWT